MAQSAAAAPCPSERTLRHTDSQEVVDSKGSPGVVEDIVHVEPHSSRTEVVGAHEDVGRDVVGELLLDGRHGPREVEEGG